MRETAGRLGAELAQARCSVSIREEMSVVGRWDRARVGQVVTNLPSNAIKFGPGQPIEIAIATERGVARLVVRDHGIGIAPDRCGRTFERFERGVPDTHYGGLGLGLYTADPNGTFRGGFYADTEKNGPGCFYVTTAHNGQHWDYSTGFRCCADL